MHHPNPFDFVLFSEDGPNLKTEEQFDQMGEPLSGFLEVSLQALTPVHVVGHQKPGAQHGNSFMYRQQGRVCIPASTIRGCLRAFIEALTSGWVSQATPVYPKVFKGRHIGFSAFDAHQNKGRSNRRISPPAIDPAFRPRLRDDNKIDVASYLFGVVIESDEKDKAGRKDDHQDISRKSKVWFEDAFIGASALGSDRHTLPDIRDANAGNSFMGGAKPSASNWWYLTPDEIWKRNIGGNQLAEFVGGAFRGRKFYFHQDPIRCVEYYQTKWKYSPKRPYYPIQMECLGKGESTDVFRIYLDGVPESLAKLLVLALKPGRTIRHKLGYGKAYGYGSVAFEIHKAMFRRVGQNRIPPPVAEYTEQVRTWESLAWNEEQLKSSYLDESVINWMSLSDLACVLGWKPQDNLLFVYPAFDKKDFMQPVPYMDVTRRLPDGVIERHVIKVDHETGDQIAEALLDIKRPIHFQVYQETSTGWDKVLERSP